MTELEKKVLIEYATDDEIKKVAEKRLGKDKKFVLDVVKTNGEKVDEKNIKLVVNDEENDTKYLFTVNQRVSVSLSSKFAELLKSRPEIRRAATVNLEIPYGVISDLFKVEENRDIITTLTAYRTGYKMNEDIFGVLIAEGVVKDPSIFVEEKRTDALSVKRVGKDK